MLPARDNPFEANRIERLLTFDPAWLDLTWEEIFERALELGFRGAVVGPHGSGKTTFCDAFTLRLETAGFEVVRWFLNDHKTKPDPDELTAIEFADRPEFTMLLIDGAEFLSPTAWRRLYRDTEKFAGLFVTIHRENSLPKPRLPVFLETVTKPEMLLAFAKRLAPEFAWDEAELRAVFQKSGENLREALWSCYDRVAATPLSN